MNKEVAWFNIYLTKRVWSMYIAELFLENELIIRCYFARTGV